MGDSGEMSMTAQNCTITYTNEWSSNGDRSLKIFSNSNKTFYFGPNSVYLNIHSLCLSKTIQFLTDINTSIPLYLRIFSQVDGNWVAHSVLVNSSANNVSITVDVPLNCTNLWFRIDSTKGYEDITCYTDNWRLIIIED